MAIIGMKYIEQYAKKQMYRRMYNGKMNLLQDALATWYQRRIVTKTYLVVDGLKIWDPRKMEFVVSDNPALIMSDLIATGRILASITPNQAFWDSIGELADFCDSRV